MNSTATLILEEGGDLEPYLAGAGSDRRRMCLATLLQQSHRRPPPYARQRRAGWNNSTRFPEGSTSRICEPPGPVTISLRN